MEITAQQVKELRDRTSVGMLACKKALEEANGDMDAAIELLRKRGEAKASEKAEREAAEGLIALHGRTLVKIHCETDFVARNADFQAFVQEVARKGVDAESYFDSVKTDKIQSIGENLIFGGLETVEGGDTIGGYVHSNGKVAALVALQGGTEEQARDVAMHVTAMNPEVVSPEDMPQDVMDKEREIAAEQLANEGKPAEIIEKILEGKLKKFAAEHALTSQAFVKDPSQTIAAYLGDAKVVAFARVEI